MRIVRRLGTSPTTRGSLSGTTCPDVFELDTGDYAVIGTHAPELADSLPPDAAVAGYERIVVVPRAVMIAAVRDVRDTDG